jgi:glycosyltransferase involved in cell wall biosynthesis
VLDNGEGIELEIIAIDDGSTDNSVEIRRDKYPMVTILRQENQGPAAARIKELKKLLENIWLF